MDTKELLERIRVLRRYASVRYPMFKDRGASDLDDLCQWAAERWISGRNLKQKPGYLIIDYLRQTIDEHVRSRNGQAKKYQLISFEKIPLTFERLTYEQDENVNREIDSITRDQLIDELLTETLNMRELAIMRYFLDGLNQREIGEKFGVDDSSINQRLKKIIPKLQRAVKYNPRFAELEDFL